LADITLGQLTNVYESRPVNDECRFRTEAFGLLGAAGHGNLCATRMRRTRARAEQPSRRKEGGPGARQGEHGGTRRLIPTASRLEVPERVRRTIGEYNFSACQFAGPRSWGAPAKVVSIIRTELTGRATASNSRANQILSPVERFVVCWWLPRPSIKNALRRRCSM
jgi:hypothetical protein